MITLFNNIFNKTINCWHEVGCFNRGGTEAEEWDAEFKTRNTAPKAMLCVNYCICIKKVLYGWFYPLQLDYFLTHDRNNSFHLLFYRSLCYSVYVYIHNTFLWEKITWFFFLDRMIPISLKKLCLEGGLELWWFFISYGIKTVLWQLRQSNCCSKIAQMSSELLSDRSNRLKSSCEVLNFHSIIWSVVMEGVSGDKS